MAKSEFEFSGFLFNDVLDSVDKPSGAFLTRVPYRKGLRLADIDLIHVPMDTFNNYVVNERVNGLYIKDGELLLRAMRDNMRGKESVSSTVEVATTIGAATAASALTSASTTVIPTAVTITEGAALTAAAEAGTTALATTAVAAAPEVLTAEVVGVAATTSAATIALPIILLASAVVAAPIAGKAIGGALTSKKVYSYSSLRLLNKHVELADKSDKHIAMCITGVCRKKKYGTVLTFAAYGSGLKEWVRSLIEGNPDLPGSVATPLSNVTNLQISYDAFMSNDISCGYNLMYNTQIIGTDSYVIEMSKKSKVPKEQLTSLRSKLNDITLKSISSVEIAEEYLPTEIGNVDNIKQYCEKMGMEEGYFWESEAARLIPILGTTRENLPKDIALLL